MVLLQNISKDWQRNGILCFFVFALFSLIISPLKFLDAASCYSYEARATGVVGSEISPTPTLTIPSDGSIRSATATSKGVDVINVGVGPITLKIQIPENGTVQSTSDLTDVVAFGGFLADRVISTAQASCSNPMTLGTTTFTNATFFNAPVPENLPPNTRVPVGEATFIFNEQIISENHIIVNALHFTAPGLDVIVGQSIASMPTCPSGGCSDAPPAILKLIISAAPIKKAKVGKKIKYDFLIENVGNSTVSNLSITDIFQPPAQPLLIANCIHNSLESGQTDTCAAQYTITEADLRNGSIENTAIVSGTTPNGNIESSKATLLRIEFPLLPPKKAKGFQKKVVCHHESNIKAVNILKWKAPSSGTMPIAYRIYSDTNLTKLLAEIPSTDALKYRDPQHHQGKMTTYYIVSVDRLSNQSSPAAVVVKP